MFSDSRWLSNEFELKRPVEAVDSFETALKLLFE